METDIIDTILHVGEPNYVGDNVLTQRFQSFYGSRYGLSKIHLQPICLLYMVYSSILSLPLTDKMQKYQIEGILLRKNVRNIKLVISHKTDDGSVSLKVIYMVFGNEVKHLTYSLLRDIYSKLNTLKKTYISQDVFRNAIAQAHFLSFEVSEAGYIQVTTGRYSLDINPNFLESGKITRGFVIVEPKINNQYLPLDTYFKNCQSDSMITAKMGAYTIAKIMLTDYQLWSRKARLSKLQNSVYSYLLGTLEFNFATSYNLKIHPVINENGKTIDHIIILNDQRPIDWTFSSSAIVLKLTNPKSPSITDESKAQIARVVKELRSSEYCVDKEKIIILSTDHETVKNAFTIPVPEMNKIDVDHLQASTQILVEEIEATKKVDIIETLLNLDNFQENGPKVVQSIDSSIKKLSPNKGEHTLKSYIYGLLMAKDTTVEKYIFKSGYWDNYLTAMLFRYANSAKAVVVHIIDLPDTWGEELTSTFKNYLHERTVPLHQFNIQICLEVLMSESANNVLYINEIDPKSSLNSEYELAGIFQRMPDLKPDELIAYMEMHAEEYQSVKGSLMDSVISSVKSDLSRRISPLTDADIMHFFRGFFSNYQQIQYARGFLGVMAEQNKPLFINVVATNNHHSDTQKQLEEAVGSYAWDYYHSEGRRVASFVSIAHNVEDLGLMKFTSFGRHRQTFQGCVVGQRKKRANAGCPVEEEKVSEEPIKFGKIRKGLQVVGKVSQVIMTAQIFKSMISALIRQDYKDFALNTAFLVSGPLMESLSVRLMTKGVSMSSALVGRPLVVAAPFLARLPLSGFVAYDLIQQIKDFKAGNSDAKVNIVGDSSILAIEITSASIEGMEALGLVSGVADVFGPVGLAISTVIFVGTDIYSAVKSVERIDHIIHLTVWQKLQTGFLAFLHLSPSKTVQKELDDQTIADLTAKNVAAFFEQYSFVKYYFFPTYKTNGRFTENNFLNVKELPKNENLTAICTKQYYGIDCKNMNGYRGKATRGLTFILLGNGTDRVKTFDNEPTTFVIGNGMKTVVGSQTSDTFILNGDTTEGHLDGRAGINVLNGVHFSIANIIHFNLANNILRYSNKTIKITNINNFISRPKVQDYIVCGCSTTFIEALGGQSISNPDRIFIPSNNNCSYNLMIKVDGYINIANLATNGKFKYTFFEAFNAKISLRASLHITNSFFFNFSIKDIKQLNVMNDTIYLKINSSGLQVNGVNGTSIFNFDGGNSQLRINGNTSMVSVNSTDTIESIQTQYFQLAEQLKAIVYVYSTVGNMSCLFGSSQYVNMLPSDPYRITHLFGGLNQNIFRIAVPDLHNTSYVSYMPPVTIYSYSSGNFVNVLDLYEMIVLVQEMLGGRVFVEMSVDAEVDILIKVFAEYNTRKFNVINITLDDALINDSLHHLIVNMRRPMKIMHHEENLFLAPMDYYLLNSSYTLIHKGLIEAYTTIVTDKYLIDYETYRYENNSIILTNVNFVENDEDLVFLIFENFFNEPELQTLRIKFEDQVLSFNRMLHEIEQSEEFDDQLDVNDNGKVDFVKV